MQRFGLSLYSTSSISDDLLLEKLSFGLYLLHIHIMFAASAFHFNS